MFSVLNEAVNKLMDGFFQQQEENRRLHKRCDDLQKELREMQARLATEHEEFERRIEAVPKFMNDYFQQQEENRRLHIEAASNFCRQNPE